MECSVKGIAGKRVLRKEVSKKGLTAGIPVVGENDSEAG